MAETAPTSAYRKILLRMSQAYARRKRAQPKEKTIRKTRMTAPDSAQWWVVAERLCSLSRKQRTSMNRRDCGDHNAGRTPRLPLKERHEQIYVNHTPALSWRVLWRPSP